MKVLQTKFYRTHHLLLFSSLTLAEIPILNLIEGQVSMNYFSEEMSFL